MIFDYLIIGFDIDQCCAKRLKQMRGCLRGHRNKFKSRGIVETMES